MVKPLVLKKGFTLIEILLVIAIVAILTVLSVAGYTSFRKAALIDLSADSLVAQINAMKDDAIHGTKYGQDQEGEKKYLKCYGLKFEKVDENYEMSAVVYKFTDKKVWDVMLRKWVYQGCGEELPDGILDKDSMVKIEKLEEINMQDGSKTDVSEEKFIFRFVPPNGDLEVFKNGDFQTGEGAFAIKIRYGEGEDDAYSKVVLIDLETGKIEKILE